MREIRTAVRSRKVRKRARRAFVSYPLKWMHADALRGFMPRACTRGL